MENIWFNSLAYADLHGSIPKIPKKYRDKDTPVFFCGDIPNNYPENFTPCIKENGKITTATWQVWNYRQIDIAKEAKQQEEWLDVQFVPSLVMNGINLDNVIIVRGNHCFCDYESRFKNALNCGSKTINFRGLKIGLLTGVIEMDKEWNDEISESEFEKRIYAIDPEIDILISHVPTYGIADRSYGQNHIGSQTLYKAIFGLHSQDKPYFTKLTYHIFGHAHGNDNRGVYKHEIENRLVRFVNCAETGIDLALGVDKSE